MPIVKPVKRMARLSIVAISCIAVLASDAIAQPANQAQDPLPEDVQKITQKTTEGLEQLVDITSFALESAQESQLQLPANSGSISGLDSTSGNLSDLDSTILAFRKMKSLAVYAGYAMFLVDFVLSLFPAEDKTYALLQKVDSKVVDLKIAMDESISETEKTVDLSNQLTALRGTLARFRTPIQNLNSFQLKKSRNETSAALPFLEDLSLAVETQKVDEIGGFCKPFTSQSPDIFTSMSNKTNGSLPDVTALGLKVLGALSQGQRLQAYLYYNKATAIKQYPIDQERARIAADWAANGLDSDMSAAMGMNSGGKGVRTLYEECADSLIMALDRLNDDNVIRKYADNIFHRLKDAKDRNASTPNFPAILGIALKKNFPHKDWTVIAYDDVTGSDLHYMRSYSHLSSFLHLRSDSNQYGKSIVINWSDTEPLAFTRNRWDSCKEKWPDKVLGGPQIKLYTSENIGGLTPKFCQKEVNVPQSEYPYAFEWYGQPGSINKLVAWSSRPDRVVEDIKPGCRTKWTTVGQGTGREKTFCTGVIGQFTPFSLIVLAGPPKSAIPEIRLTSPGGKQLAYTLNTPLLHLVSTGPDKDAVLTGIRNLAPNLRNEDVQNVKNSNSPQLIDIGTSLAFAFTNDSFLRRTKAVYEFVTPAIVKTTSGIPKDYVSNTLNQNDLFSNHVSRWNLIPAGDKWWYLENAVSTWRLELYKGRAILRNTVPNNTTAFMWRVEGSTKNGFKICHRELATACLGLDGDRIVVDPEIESTAFTITRTPGMPPITSLWPQ